MKPILALAAVALLFLNAVAQTPGAVWRPRGTYWDTYRSVIVKAVCDSTGRVEQAELLFSGASPAEADSILDQVKHASFDPNIYDGRIRKGKYEHSPDVPDLQYIVPYAVRGKGQEVKPQITRKELERAGLGQWLSIWDRLLPQWPVESWSYVGAGDFFEYTSTINDSQHVSLGMISISPNQKWHLHPFVGVEITNDGRASGDVDGGFAVYTLGDSVRVRQHVTGTPVSYCSAEWIDNDRFVVTAIEEIDLDFGGKVTFYHAPLLLLGDVHSSKFTWLSGPPVPIESAGKAWKDLDEYEKRRYPKLRF